MLLKQWAVGMTTAPRRASTLEKSLASLALAGWNTPRLFVEPETTLPTERLSLPITQRDQPLGAFPNWYLGLTELYVRQPDADAYLMCQDDVLFTRGLRNYLEQMLWPAANVGVISLYCPSHEHRDFPSGFMEIDPGWGAWGALAYVFSNPGVRAFLSDAEVVNHRHHGPGEGQRNIDSVVGAWCRRNSLPYFVHVPSLAQHIGETSTIWKRGGVGGRRAAIHFDPEFPLRQIDSQSGSTSGSSSKHPVVLATEKPVSEKPHFHVHQHGTPSIGSKGTS